MLRAARFGFSRSGSKEGDSIMLNTIGQRESLALALAAGARLDKYVDDDEGKAMANVVDTVKAASCGLVDHMCEPRVDKASQAGANGAPPRANGAATGEAANKDRDGHGRFPNANRA